MKNVIFDLNPKSYLNELFEKDSNLLNLTRECFDSLFKDCISKGCFSMDEDLTLVKVRKILEKMQEKDLLEYIQGYFNSINKIREAKDLLVSMFFPLDDNGVNVSGPVMDYNFFAIIYEILNRWEHIQATLTSGKSA
ncbi:MAG: hypothetical protein ACOC3S_01335 [Bacteroidota bacterium]